MIAGRTQLLHSGDSGWMEVPDERTQKEYAFN